jgi:hypothetical protein
MRRGQFYNFALVVRAASSSSSEEEEEEESGILNIDYEKSVYN